MLKNRIEAGEIVLGTMISEFGCPNLLRIMQAGGYEFVIIDCEHGPFDYVQLSEMTALGNSIRLPVLVRAPGIDRGFITKVLDMGADGFLIPMVNTPEEAEKLVEYAKYAPLGKRGISTTRAHTGYRPPYMKDYMESANRRTILFAQIETGKAVANAEKIASVQGIDALIVGPSDLSSDLGAAGELSNPELLNCAEKVVKAAFSCGKRCGTVSSNMEYLRICREMGMNIFDVGSELGMLLKGASENVNRFWKETA